MSTLFKSITAGEWKFLLIVSIILIVITGGPFLYATLVQPTGQHYLGLTALTPSDNFVYYSYINQIRRGNVVLQNLFTPEQDGVGLFNIFWFLAGWLAKIFNLSAALTFHLLRLLLIPPFLIVAYRFISIFFSQPFLRKLTLILLSFSSGIGAYVVVPLYAAKLNIPAYWSPNDIWIPESITFLTLYKTPHFIASLTLMLLIFLLMHTAFTKKRIDYAVGAGLVALVYFNFHPFYIPTIFGTVALYLLLLIIKQRKILWQEVGYLAILISVSAPSIIYHVRTLASSQVLAGRAFQNVTLAPPWYFLLAGYGLLWLLAALGLVWLIKKQRIKSPHLLLFSLLAVCLTLIHLPIQFQSRYTQGLHPALVILSVYGLLWLHNRFFSSWPDLRSLLSRQIAAASLFFIVLLTMSNLFVLTRDLYYFNSQPGRISEYFYVTQDTEQIVQKLRQRQDEVVIFSGAQNSLVIPAFTQHRTYASHNIESLDFGQRVYYLQWFFGSDQDAEQKGQFLVQNNIDYLLYTPLEKNMGSFDPTTKQYLQSEIDLPQATLYKVVTE